MQKITHYLLWALLLLLLLLAKLGGLSSCTSDFEGDFPDEKPVPVLNAILTADSLIEVELAWSQNPESGAAFSPVSEAVIDLRENDLLIPAPEEVEPGHYLFQHRAGAGQSYRIEVAIQGRDTLRAETQIPESVQADVEMIDNALGTWNKRHFRLTTGKGSENMAGMWIIATSYTEDSVSTDQSSALYSNSPLPDTFNRTYDSSVPDGYLYEYDFFIRIDSRKLIAEKQQLWFVPFSLPEKNDIYIISASQDYDSYFKDVWTQKSWDPEVDLPFSYQPVFIHSNIVNGYGIFAGCSLTRFRF